jgi:hypothetical protein
MRVSGESGRKTVSGGGGGGGGSREGGWIAGTSYTLLRMTKNVRLDGMASEAAEGSRRDEKLGRRRAFD